MRTRDEVLREFPVDLQGIRDSYMEISAYHVERMADRIRELESQLVSNAYTLPVAASEPVAWALWEGDTMLHATTNPSTVASWQKDVDRGPRMVPLRIVPLYAHPSAAAVRVTDAMVRTAFVRLYPGCEPDEMQHYHAADIRAALTAALTAASEQEKPSAAAVGTLVERIKRDLARYNSDDELQRIVDTAASEHPTTPTRGSDE